MVSASLTLGPQTFNSDPWPKPKEEKLLIPVFHEKTLTFQFLSPHSTELVVCGLYRMLFSRIVKAEAIIEGSLEV